MVLCLRIYIFTPILVLFIILLATNLYFCRRLRQQQYVSLFTDTTVNVSATDLVSKTQALGSAAGSASILSVGARPRNNTIRVVKIGHLKQIAIKAQDSNLATFANSPHIS